MTALLRWHSVGFEAPDHNTPLAYIPGWEGQKEYFVLQQFIQGEWHDVPTEEPEDVED